MWNITCYELTNVTVHEKTRLTVQFAIVCHAHMKVKSLYYFLLKSRLSNDNKVKSVWDNTVVFWIFVYQFSYLSVLLKHSFLKKWPINALPWLLVSSVDYPPCSWLNNHRYCQSQNRWSVWFNYVAVWFTHALVHSYTPLSLSLSLSVSQFNRPDMTFAVDWRLKTSYLFYVSIFSV